MIWLAIVLTGVGSYVLRLIPLVVLPQRARSAPRSSVPSATPGSRRSPRCSCRRCRPLPAAGDLRPTLVAAAVALALAVRGAAMLRVVSLGGLAYVAVLRRVERGRLTIRGSLSMGQTRGVDRAGEGRGGATRVEIALLGRFEVTIDGVPGREPQAGLGATPRHWSRSWP